MIKTYMFAAMLAVLAPANEAVFNKCLEEQPDVSKVWARDPVALRFLRDCVSEEYTDRLLRFESGLDRPGLKRHD